ncbi:MAG: metallopeptidase TldD-related protein, partial [Myxococcota bacterium]
GILQTWLIDVYHSRRLKREPTVSDISNLVVPAGARSPAEILAERDWVIVVDGFLGGNSNPTTGRYSFGIRGTLYEGGSPISPVSEMNITGSIFDLLDGFAEAANDTWTNGACRSPSLLFDAVQFSGQ